MAWHGLVRLAHKAASRALVISVIEEQIGHVKTEQET